MPLAIREKPATGCKIYASNSHHSKNENDYIGEAIKVDGNILKFRDIGGDTDSLIWRFKDGLNKTVYFGG